MIADRRSLFLALAVTGLVTSQALPARAVSRPFTESQSDIYLGVSGGFACNHDSGFVSTASSASCSGLAGAWEANSSASASYGDLGVYALALNSVQSDAVAQWSDVFTVSGGPTNCPSCALGFTFHLFVKLVGSATAGGASNAGSAMGQVTAAIIPLSNPSANVTRQATISSLGAGDSCVGGCEVDISTAYDPTQQYVFNVYLSATAIGAPGVEAIANFADTVTVAGVGLYDASGHRVDTGAFVFSSGAVYPVGPGSLPEPNSALLLLAGAAALALRRPQLDSSIS